MDRQGFGPMHAVNYSEASENLEVMIDKVVVECAPLAITLERDEGAVLISVSEWVSSRKLAPSQTR